MGRASFNGCSGIPKFAEDYNPSSCRWIEGEGKGKNYSCENVPISGRSYCQEHLKKVYLKFKKGDC